MEWQTRLKQSNRPAYDVMIGELGKEASASVLSYILGDGFDKAAAYSAFDRIAQTKRMIQNMTGAHEDKAAELASFILVKANAIHEQYGGNYDEIVRKMIEKLGEKQSAVNRANHAKSGVTIVPWTRFSQRKLDEMVTERLRSDFGLYGDAAENACRALNKAAYNLTIDFRKTKGDILQAMLDVHAANADAGVFAVDNLYSPDPSRTFRDAIHARLEGTA